MAATTPTSKPVKGNVPVEEEVPELALVLGELLLAAR